MTTCMYCIFAAAHADGLPESTATLHGVVRVASADIKNSSMRDSKPWSLRTKRVAAGPLTQPQAADSKGVCAAAAACTGGDPEKAATATAHGGHTASLPGGIMSQRSFAASVPHPLLQHSQAAQGEGVFVQHQQPLLRLSTDSNSTTAFCGGLPQPAQLPQHLPAAGPLSAHAVPAPQAHPHAGTSDPARQDGALPQQQQHWLAVHGMHPSSVPTIPGAMSAATATAVDPTQQPHTGLLLNSGGMAPAVLAAAGSLASSTGTAAAQAATVAAAAQAAGTAAAAGMAQPPSGSQAGAGLSQAAAGASNSAVQFALLEKFLAKQQLVQVRWSRCTTLQL